MLKNIKGWLYIILDRETLNKGGFLKTARKIIKSGPDIIQIRDKGGFSRDVLKTSKVLKPLCRKHKVKLIMNDRLDLAMLADCNGVHLGQDDIPVRLARSLLGRNKIIGVSCHSLKQAQDAQSAGANYVSIGPIFTTPTKPEYKPVGIRLISQVRNKIRIPFFAIGDIKLTNLKKVIQAGARNIAICREVCLDRDPSTAVKRIKAEIRKYI